MLAPHIEANSTENWNAIWKREGHDTWRKDVLKDVYDRIVALVPAGARVLDVGGGVGILARRLRDEKQCEVIVIDHAEDALRMASITGLWCAVVDLENDAATAPWFGVSRAPFDVLVCTEVAEHLSARAYANLLCQAATLAKLALISVPNDRLGPEEEPQHARQLTAMGFLGDLRFNARARSAPHHVRVECIGPVVETTRAPAFLLGVISDKPKPHTLSMTLPVRDEADDLPLTLASFRGVADEIVVGVDPRTKDATREVAAKYADVVFEIENPRGPDPDGDNIPENGVHFSWIRNQCIDWCTGEWVFMTEGHEHLAEGVDVLLRLGEIVPEGTKVAYVWRTSNGQRWGYPWVFKNDSRLRFTRSTHNQLQIPGGALEVRLPQVRTLHRRSHNNLQARAKQRKVQNRRTLLDDWTKHKNLDSLYYLGSEMRDWDPAKAVERMEEFLAMPAKNGAARYQTRLQLALDYAENGKPRKAREVLIRAAEDDWSRVEHWLWLGDLAMQDERFEEALQFYRYATTSINDPPFSLWWIDEDVYTYLPAQRMTMVLAELGRLKEALEWARKVIALFPDEVPAEARDEAEAIVKQLEDAAQAS